MRTDHLARYIGRHTENPACRQDLPGLQSHARYSVFKDRRHVERFSRGEKRTGNLAAALVEVNWTFLQGGLYSCSTRNIGRVASSVKATGAI